MDKEDSLDSAEMEKQLEEELANMEYDPDEEISDRDGASVLG